MRNGKYFNNNKKIVEGTRLQLPDDHLKITLLN